MLKKDSLKRTGLVILTIIGLAFLPAVSTQAACPDDIFAYWKMDEPTPGAPGGTYTDFIKGNNGTGNVNPTAVTGIIGGAQEFDGTNTQINVPADNSFDWQNDESFSIEFWVKTDTIPIGDFPLAENQVVIGRVINGGLQWWVGIQRAEGKPSFTLKDVNDNGPSPSLSGVGTIVLTDGNWHHVVAVRDDDASIDGDNIIYVDGVEQGRVTHDYTAGFGSSTAAVNIGWLDFPFTTGFRFDGLIDEVALYDRALSPTEIQAHFSNRQPVTDYCSGDIPFAPSPDDLISFWQLDEPTPVTPGGTYEDEFNGNDGTGDVNPTAVTGIIGGAQEFDGTNTQINVPADNSFDWQNDENFSIEFWVKTDSIPIGDFPLAENQVVIGRIISGGLQWWVGIQRAEGKPSFTLKDVNDNGPSPALSGVGTIVLTDGNWHHVVAVRDDGASIDGDNIIYVDGVEQGRVTHDYTAGFGSSTAAVNIGWLDFPLTTGFRFDGLIDEVALYDRALSPTEIMVHHDEGRLGNGINTLRPVADAGGDQQVNDGSVVTLDGSNSSGAIASHLWEQTGGGTPVTLTGANTDTATFTAPDVAAGGEVLTFQLTVTDNDGLIDTDTAIITVNDSSTAVPPPAGGGGGGGCFISTMF